MTCISANTKISVRVNDPALSRSRINLCKYCAHDGEVNMADLLETEVVRDSIGRSRNICVMSVLGTDKEYSPYRHGSKQPATNERDDMKGSRVELRRRITHCYDFGDSYFPRNLRFHGHLFCALLFAQRENGGKDAFPFFFACHSLAFLT